MAIPNFDALNRPIDAYTRNQAQEIIQNTWKLTKGVFLRFNR